MKYPKRRFSKDDASSQASKYGTDALNSINTSPMFSMQTPLISQVKELTKRVQDVYNDEHVSIFFCKLTSKLWKKVAAEVRGKCWTEDMRSRMWSQFHILRGNHKLQKEWKVLLDALQIEREKVEEIFLYQHVLEEVFGQLLHAMMNKDCPPQVAILPNTTMDENEEQALRYCAGYVPLKLTKRYKRMQTNNTAVIFTKLLRSWANIPNEEDDNFIDFTSRWLQKQNRGGLFHINSNVYNFFKSMELVVRSIVQRNNIDIFMQSDMQVILFGKIQQSDAIWKCWGIISSDLPKQAELKLFEEVVKCFLKMRCEAFVKVYIMIRKNTDNTVGRKGEKSLRKQLRE